MRHFNFNNSTKNAISRLSFAFSIIACILFTGTAWGQAKVTVESNISATDSLVFQVWGVDDASVSATPVERTSPNGKQLYCAYDIDITKDGREWQPEPEQPAMVSMQDPNFADGQMLDIYHEGANGLEFVATVASENGKITFPAHSFSVYIVAEAEDYNRIKVLLHRANDVVTIYVKKLDLDTYHGTGNFNRIVYNPGFGTIPDGVVCMGWSANSDYDVEDISDEMTYDEIRDSIKTRLNAGVATDGTELHFYTMLFKSYSVTYFDDNHAVIQTDLLLSRADGDITNMPYTVNAPYTPPENHNFDGWKVKTHEDGEHIHNHTDDDYVYTNNDFILITGDVVFDVEAPEGQWLVFNENGKGATYNAPEFVLKGQNTVRPTLAEDRNMIRNGYSFGGWYTDQACTTPFAFGSPIEERTEIYAKWTPKATASYTVIIWKENISADGYDFGESIQLTGNSNTIISTVLQQGSGNNAYARVNGTNKQYTGFHLDHFDSNVNINPEGNSVLNVYYDRTSYTLTFRKNGSGTVYKTITAKYEQSIGSNFPISVNGNTEYRWEPQSSSTFNQVLVYIDIMPAENVTFHRNSSTAATRYMEFYVEVLPGQTGTRTFNGKRFVKYGNTIPAKYNYFTETEDFVVLSGCNKYGSDPAFSNGRADVSDGGTLRLYYTRQEYSINFMDGTYYDGNGNPINDELSQYSGVVETGIAYDKDVSDYNSYRPASVPAGYVFEGWFVDKPCTHPYTFTRMPKGGISVYAKWRKIQYRVFLHPKAGTDPTLDWGSNSQAMNFRISYGSNISVPKGIRDDYEQIGWYTDEAYTNLFNSNLVLNESSVRTTYNKETELTDNMNKWGDIESDSPHPEGTVEPGYNSDLYNYDTVRRVFTERDRFWITKKFDLYAKWRAKLRGANGIAVEYVDDEGNNDVPVDAYLYQDGVNVIAGHATTHPDSRMEFSHWVLQEFNWDRKEFEDTRTHIYPGATFTAHKDDAKKFIYQWYNPENPEEIWGGVVDPWKTENPDRDGENKYTEYRATYTVRLRAEYITKEKPEHTYIEWFRNDGTVEQISGESTSTPTLGINEAVQPPVPAERTGYNFVGWYRSEDGTGEPVTNCEPNFLHYNNGAFTEGSFVAADNYSPRQYLYAIWEPKVEFDLPSVCQGAPVELPLETKYYVDLSADGWSWTASSGTVDGRIFTPSEGESVTLTFNPASSTCAPSTSFSMALKTPNIPNADLYDYIWRGGLTDLNTASDWNTTSNWFVHNNGDYSIATAMPSRESNIFIGAADCVTSNWPSQTNEANAHNITIASGASLTVPTGMTLNIAGNLDNTGSLNATNGTVVFCGPESNGGNQTISHDITFGNVIFYNQGGDIIPAGNVTINGAANFKNGVVKHDVTFGEDASVTDPVGMSHNSFVEGKVTKSGNANGFTFPTGKDNVLGKIEATSDAENVSVQYFSNSAGFTQAEIPRWWNINDMCSNNRPQLDHVSNVEYWNVSTPLALEAVLTVSAASGTAHFNTNTATHDADDIFGAFWSGSCWENIGGDSQSVSADPYGTISVAVKIPQTRAAYEKIVTLGSKDHNTILPIELTSFSATCDGRSSHVMWTTATEKNNDYFSLERSDDAINFTEIARIAGAGNSIEPLNYSYIDYGVYGGDNYYRLVQVDYDGTRTASEIIVTNCVEASGEPEVLAYPNPFNSDLTVELENFGDRPASIEVYDVLGRLVYVEKADAPQNSYQTILHLDGLSNSTYTVRVSTSDFVINQKVVKN